MTTVRIPGKLYLAGEYAVTHPGQPAVIIAVDRFLELTVSEATTSNGSFYSEGYTDTPLLISRKNDRPELPSSFELIQQTLQLIERYIQELGNVIRPYDLYLRTDLELHGQKIGLGSSGAVTVALVHGLLEWHHLPTSPLLVYKLAALAHLALGSHGSLGDLAACSFTGCIRYRSPNRQAIRNLYENTSSLLATIRTPWPELSIERLPFPANCRLLIGWTKQPAATEQLISQPKPLTDQQLSQFLATSRNCVDQLVQGLKEQNHSAMADAFTNNRALLQLFAKQRQMIIETPMLKTLCDCAEQFGAAGKTSGAGGGDCGFALVHDRTMANQITQCWQQAGITPLNLAIYTRKDDSSCQNKPTEKTNMSP